MDLSIIVVNYNTKKLTVDCIKSIFKYPPKIKFEIIVVDNGSTDGSIQELRKRKDITFIENDRNFGFAKANNIGIKTAKGNCILLLNSDTEVKKDSINALVEFSKEKADIGAVGSRLLNSDGSMQASVFRYPTILRAIRQYWFGEKSILDKYTPLGDDPVEVEILSMASFLITPLALSRVGLLDEKYFMYFEDFDYCRRIKKVGLRIYYLPTSEVVHHHGASGKNITQYENQWRRLIPSSKIYHGTVKHYIYNFILWSGQKLANIF